MALFLNNQDQESSITAKGAVEAMADGVRQMAHGNAIRRPRIDNMMPTGKPDSYFIFGSMEGGIRDPGYFAVRLKPDVLVWANEFGKMRENKYTGRPGLYGGLVLLFSTQNGELLAIMNDGYVQHLRVAATAALGIKYLARENARVMAIYGTGGMGRFFALTAQEVRPLDRIQVYSPNPANRALYKKEMASKVRCEIVLADSPEAAAKGADIIATCTSSMEPTVQPAWLKPGMHFNSVNHWEVSPALNAKFDTAGVLLAHTPPSVAGFVDDDFDIRRNVMSWLAGTPEERAKVAEIYKRAPVKEPYPKAKIVECVDWKTNVPYARTRGADEITVFANHSFGTLEGEIGVSAGIQGLQFAAIGGRIYEGAKKQGLGLELPQEMFLQTMRT